MGEENMKVWVIKMRSASLALALLFLFIQAASSQETFSVAPIRLTDEKAVFATVESSTVVPARARIGGTVVSLAVKEGDAVKQGQVVATIGDEKLALQMKSLDAQIAGLEAQFAQSQSDLVRAQDLFARGTVSRTRLDEAQTQFNVVSNTLKARIAERSVIQQQVTEGDVLAPSSGRVLKRPVTAGAVVLSGEAIVTIAEQNYVLRLRVPERHARFLKAGDPVRIAGDDPGKSGAQFGTVRLVYPQIEDGRVVADAIVDDLGDYFVGERIRVWVSAGERSGFVIPSSFITTRFGIDYVRLRNGADGVIEVPVQRGREVPRPGMPDALEILSGLKAGDVLVRP
jgi:RND family efflux transporter MFP subunit